MIAKSKSRLRFALGIVTTMVTTLTAVNILPLALLAQSGYGADKPGGPGPGPIGPGPGCNNFPAPPSVGASVDLSYFGPPPSETNPSFVGPYQLLKSGTVDVQKGTVTLPLYKGKMKGTGKTVWYILTDTDDKANAKALGLNFSSKLSYSAPGARTAQINQDGDLVFDQGTVDFSGDNKVVPGPSKRPFPPAAAQPGSVGDKDYSPLVRIINSGGHIYNAPIIAFDVSATQINFPKGKPDYKLLHDEVVAIDTAKHTVTLNLINGFSFGRPVLYLSMDSNDPTVAAIEHATYAPALKRIKTGQDDSFSSAVERIFIATNGPQDDGCANPQRQGLFAALTDTYRPNNTFGGIPTFGLDYSPLWDAQLYEWTPDAIKKGYRSQLREEFRILTLVQDGILTGPNGSEFGSTGIIINCPPVYRLV